MEETLRIGKFDGKNDDFGLWSMQMESILEAAGLMDIVRGVEVKPLSSTNVNGVQIGGEINNFNKRLSKARAILVNSLGIRPLRTIQKVYKDPVKIWKKLH